MGFFSTLCSLAFAAVALSSATSAKTILFVGNSFTYGALSLETSPGKSLEWHWANRRSVLDRRWDRIVLQEYSTLDIDRPGDPANLVAHSGELAGMFKARNPRARIGLVATWSRPDLIYSSGKPWSGKAIAICGRLDGQWFTATMIIDGDGSARGMLGCRSFGSEKAAREALAQAH